MDWARAAVCCVYVLTSSFGMNYALHVAEGKLNNNRHREWVISKQSLFTSVDHCTRRLLLS